MPEKKTHHPDIENTTSRERLRKVLKHEVPDRVPIDLGSTRSSGISAIAYNRLRKRMGLDKNRLSRMYDFIQQLAYVDNEIMKSFHIDVIDAGQGFLESDNDWKEWSLNDSSKCLIPKYLNIEIDNEGTVYALNKDGTKWGRKPKTSLYVDQFYWVYENLSSLPEEINESDISKSLGVVPSPPWHLDIFNPEHYNQFIHEIRKLYEKTDYSIVLSVGGNMFESGTSLRGMANFMIDMYTDKKKTKYLLDKLVEINLAKLKMIIDGVGEYVDLLQFGDDLGGQESPFMSPDIYREVFKPRHKKMWDLVHSSSNCKILLHSCGSIYKLIPDLIDAGLDALNPVQTTAKDMDPARLKKEFGRDLVFWGGGCNTRDVLAKGTPGQIREDVKKRISILGDQGGMVFNPIHNILADVPPENIIALFEAAYEYGQY